MRKGKGTAEPEPVEPVERVSVRQFRARLANIISNGKPVVVVKHGVPVSVLLPTGVTGWEGRWDHALHVRNVRRHAAAVVKALNGD